MNQFKDRNWMVSGFLLFMEWRVRALNALQILWLSERLLWNHSRFLLEMQRISLDRLWCAFTGFSAYSQVLAMVTINLCSSENNIRCDDRLFLWCIHWKTSRILNQFVSKSKSVIIRLISRIIPHIRRTCAFSLSRYHMRSMCEFSSSQHTITRIRERSTICLSKSKICKETLHDGIIFPRSIGRHLMVLAQNVNPMICGKIIPRGG
jgi:hypothetical protein